MNAKEFIYHTVITEDQLDAFGHVNNSEYLKMFERARWSMIHEKNYNMERINQEQIGPVLLEANLRFRRELLCGEQLEIKTQAIKVEGRLVTIGQKMYKLETKQLSCEASFVIGLMDLRARKLIDYTPEWLDVVGVKKPFED